MRKKFLLAAASVASLLSVTACGGGSDSAADSNSVSVLTVTKNYQIPVAEMNWAKDIEAEIGCKVDWQTVEADAWTQQKNAALASGDIADIQIKAMSPEDAAQFPDLFEPIGDHMDELPNVQSFFKAKPEAQSLATESDGTIYMLPSSRGNAYSGSGQHIMINKTWLDNLGLPMPTTWDELTATLEAFKTQDPNGNGEADEIPLNINALKQDGFTWHNPMLLLNSMGIVTSFNDGPAAQGIYVKDGKVGNFLVSDEYKETVKYLHSLMEQGLIPADALTKDNSVYRAEAKSDGKTARVGMVFGWSPLLFGDLSDQYVGLPAPAAPGVDPEDVVWDGSENEYEVGKLAVSAEAADNPCVWKLVNALYSEKGSIQQYGGKIGVELEDKGNGTYAYTEEYFKGRETSKEPSLTDRFAGWLPDNVHIENDPVWKAWREVDDVYAEQYSHFDPEKDVMPLNVRLSPEDTVTAANTDTAVMNYAMQKTSDWLMNGGVDEGWDDYVAQLNSLGIQDNVALWQAAYDNRAK